MVVNSAVYGWWWNSTNGKNPSVVPLLAAIAAAPLSAIGFWHVARDSGLGEAHPQKFAFLERIAVLAGLSIAALVLAISMTVAFTENCEWCAVAFIVGVLGSPVLGAHGAAWVGVTGITIWLFARMSRGQERL